MRTNGNCIVRGLPGVVLLLGCNTARGAQTNDLTDHSVGYVALALFVLAYALVIAEEFTDLRKSKPVLLAAGLMWAAIALVCVTQGDLYSAQEAVRHNILEYSELMLFLLVAMTYINAMNERLVFKALRSGLVRSGFSYRALFWMTGLLAFLISPFADNLTTALLMCAVLRAVGMENRTFISLGCVNVVVAANAGGAFSPFGDITTLMVWQKDLVKFWTFFHLLVPSTVNWLVPAILMSSVVPAGAPRASEQIIKTKRGARRIIVLFAATICTAVGFHNFLHLPPTLGMMTGLAYLQFLGFYLKRTHYKDVCPRRGNADENQERLGDRALPFDVFNKVARAEWDTLLFFFGVVICVGGLQFIGYLELASRIMYGQWGATYANVSVGVLSAVIDNIPIMYAVISMNPDMSVGQWLLVTMTAGVGGSLLSIGSAAGVALMGQARGAYTFFSHLRWTPAIALGCVASIAMHMWLNAPLFGS